MELKGAEIAIKTLIEQGTDVVFGYPGGTVIDLYDELYKHSDQINHILTAHEQGASHAADGYARATGKVGVCIATSGPGATNLVTGIATAYLDSIPLVAITGNVGIQMIGKDGFQEVDITGVTLPITKHNFFVNKVEKLADTIREAFKLAKSGRPGPVLVDIPKNVQNAFCDYEPAEVVAPYPIMESDDNEVNSVVEAIKKSKKPFIMVGGGAIASDCSKEIIELADKIDAYIGCSMMGLSVVPTDHPRFLGMVGMHGHYAATVALHHSDLLIAVGSRFADRVTGNTSKFVPEAKIVHIDLDASEIEKNVRADYPIVGDAKEILAKLNGRVDSCSNPDWKNHVDELKVKEAEGNPEMPGFTPRKIIECLNTYLKPETAVATDVGQNQMWAAQNVNFKAPRKFISSGGLGTMGFGLGAAIGSAFGTKERSVLVTGDGGFGMCLTEMATAVTNQVPLVILIINNHVLGMVRQWQNLFYGQRFSQTDLKDRQTDFVKLADAFGAKGMRATNMDELKAAFDAAFAENGPFIVEAVIDKDEMVLPMIPGGKSAEDIITRIGN